MTTTTTPAQPSKGHIAFIGDFEYYERSGEVYRCSRPDLAPVMTDGYRCGRWECSRAHFDAYRHLYDPSTPTSERS
jgi:hypothetical protein